ncbi:PREDICTED: survival motor neuron protein [Dinoponera quadriceps]|uniref:Survival motor neuron protein n=1 Tax=Dinoponera quadriceps TaxID=609295 RepID=A0A6P3XZG1_DINQU|nr:PREDICTED: survival motor neuron protein [Dinoponera quadriceps]
MSDNSNLLFVRGDGVNEDETTWDDTALIKAYDRAVSLAKEEVAKRIARDPQGRLSKQQSQNSKRSNQAKKPVKKWTIGAPCRTVYTADGEIYEAIVTKIYENSDVCMVKFIGYDNTEEVKLDSLLESNGLESQIAQQKNAFAEKTEQQACDSDASNYSVRQNSKQMNGEKMDCDTEDPRLYKNSFMPGPFFDMSIDGVPPAPPLPPQLMAKLPENDTDALSSMLMSWYISGFHTGYYHGMKQANLKWQKRKNC